MQQSWTCSRSLLWSDLDGEYVLSGVELIVDISPDDGRFAHRTVAKEDDFDAGSILVIWGIKFHGNNIEKYYVLIYW